MEDDWAADSLNLRFQVGLDTGTVEFADIRLERAGREASIAATRDAIQPAAVTERIRKHRMAALQVTVRDTQGRAVPGARVEVEQQRHAFLFGCNFFGLQPANDEPGQVAYRTQFTNLLNFATLPFYWGTYERRSGEPDHGRVMAMATWCREHHLTTKGHPLVWHNVYPSWAPTEPDAAVAALRARVGDLVPRFADVMDLWDVVNEANNAGEHADTGTGAWVKRDGAAAAVGAALGWARAARGNGKARLLYNDFNVGGENVDLLRALEAKGSLPDAIGLQSHMHGGPWPIDRVWRTAERFAGFGRPIHFTEVTVVSGETRDYAEAEKSAPGSWPSTPEGEAAQAHYVARFYELLFSHPQVEAITWWDFGDHRAWMNAPAGLIRADMSPKPAYTRLHELIRNAWWTREHGVTTADGRYETRVFRGTHRIRATLPDGRTLETQVAIPWDRETGTAELTAPQ
jgi:GH35 family endo-1,4-beta-xylanase